MTTTDATTIEEYVTEDGWRPAGKTGEKVPSAVGGWNRTVELRKDGRLKEMHVGPETWADLTDADWFAYSE